MKINVAIISILFLCVVVSAEINELSPIKQGECKIIPQACASCSYVNLSVIYPNSTFAITNQNMNDLGGGAWFYEFCDTSNLGRYDIVGSGDLDGVDTAFDVLYFEVTPTGAGNITTGQSNIAFISLVVVLVVGILFMVLGLNVEGKGVKIIFLGLSGLMIFISVLNSMVLLDQNLGTFSSLIESYSSFLLVIKTLVMILVLALCIFAGFQALRFWQIKRGFKDE